MQSQPNTSTQNCPPTAKAVLADACKLFKEILHFCQSSDHTFKQVETELLKRLFALGCCLLRLFLASRHDRLDIQPYLQDRTYRPGQRDAERTLFTVFGPVTYVRQYLQARFGGSGIFPLDIELRLTWDAFSPWVMQWIARLASRMSFKAVHTVCKAVLNWAPATESMEQIVLGMGREAAPFMKQLEAPKGDGDVLVIEIDGKCPPTATEEELQKRRGKRKPKHQQSCKCKGCQRHRGKENRKACGPKKRRKKGDKSKNGKEVIVVVMYSLQRGPDNKLHGPFNKKMYATFAGSKAAAEWARAEATKRGFGPETTKTVQIVMDGSSRLYKAMKKQFPKAIFTLDVWHVVERLWLVGRQYHREGSEELREYVEVLKRLLYAGKIGALLKRLRMMMKSIPPNGPGTKGKREVLRKTINYIKKRRRMMKYGEWQSADLVIGSGQVEGAVRQLVGERFDCAGMRWLKGKAEPLLHLRCIELNGDWERYVDWLEEKKRSELEQGQRLRIMTDQPMELPKSEKRSRKKAEKAA